ncbi:MAG: hypothetical protein ACT4OS_08685 [Acidimicrobiales bacterium]
MNGALETVVLVLGAMAGAVLFVLVLVALVSLIRTLASARSAIDDFHTRAVPLLDDTHEVVRQAKADLGKVDTLLTRADAISGTVDSASKLAYTLVSNPAVKVLALATGGARAVGRLRRGQLTRVLSPGRARRSKGSGLTAGEAVGGLGAAQPGLGAGSAGDEAG